MRFYPLSRLYLASLVLGDVLALFAAFFLALFTRNFSVPGLEVFLLHLVPFSFIFTATIVTFFVAGLYDLHVLSLRKRIAGFILGSQLFVVLVSVLFFYLTPGIAPKTTLALYLIFAFIAISVWRFFGAPRIYPKKRFPAVFVGNELEGKELAEAINSNSYYPFIIERVFNVERVEDIGEFKESIFKNSAALVVFDTSNPKLETVTPLLYKSRENGALVIDSTGFYEDVMGRVPISSITYRWFFEEVPVASRLYSFFKRIMDIVIAIPLFVFSLFILPFVVLLVKIDDGGEIFSVQKRMGQGGRSVRLYKIRTMNFTDSGEWLEENKNNKVTKVGGFIRATRLDELPQLINVIRGDISLIGPRPDIIGLGERLKKEIPYYELRYAVPPGLSGWAQVRQQEQPRSIEETKLRFSYDLYYVKNRSLILDLHIALKTIKTLLSRTGM